MNLFDLIAFDADDTLWHNERLYERTQAGLAALLAPYGIAGKALDERLLATESRNIAFFGYGIKSFILSMIETCEDEDRKVRLLNSLFIGSQRLANAMRTHSLIVGENKELLSSFWEAVEAFRRERKL